MVGFLFRMFYVFVFLLTTCFISAQNPQTTLDIKTSVDENSNKNEIASAPARILAYYDVRSF